MSIGKARGKEANLLFEAGVDAHWENVTEQTVQRRVKKKKKKKEGWVANC